MCGISGIIAFNESAKSKLQLIEKSIKTLQLRGPDYQRTIQLNNIALGHARLSIIDTSLDAAQPFQDASKRYSLVFNGEIFNYKELRQELVNQGIRFRTQSDTEVLLQLLIKEGTDCINKLNGFFAFAFYDAEKNETTLVRDRYGVKPFYFSSNENYIAFASEIKALLAFDVDKSINKEALRVYSHLNYIPAPLSIFNSIQKLKPGHYIKVSRSSIENYKAYYTLSEDTDYQKEYEPSKASVRFLLEKAVERRLVSDVPLGTFLSGGIDSSIITAMAALRVPNLNTFSIGFKDHPFFDETKYAELVSKKYKTNHHTFKLSNQDLLNNVNELWSYLDEPFADSSALNVYILSKETKKHVTVGLSGDGADELFAGYNKHRAEWKIQNQFVKTSLIKSGKNIFKQLPKSRNNKLSNLNRKLFKYANAAKLNKNERYWRLAGFEESNKDYSAYINPISKDFNSFLRNDLQLVLEGDMLVKADRMSMANSLEIRTPFLDYTLVDYVNSLPASFKIDRKKQKKILIDSCIDLLPLEIFNRSKKGFEVPLQQWIKNELKSEITITLSKANIENDGHFEFNEVKNLIAKSLSSNPDDSVARIWGLLCYFKWKQKFID